MDSLPLTAALLGKLFPIKGSDIERYYKHHLSDYEVWTQKEHATDWVLLPENIGEYLSIDETQLCEEVYTILSNKAGHGGQGTVVAIVKGTKADVVSRILMMTSESERAKVKEITMDFGEHKKERARLLFDLYPQMQEGYSLICKVRDIFKRKLTIDEAKHRLHEWYKDVNICTLREIKAARDCIKSREVEVLNYFINRATNASAESLNSKMKGFRAQLHGIADIPFFMYRICTIFG